MNDETKPSRAKGVSLPSEGLAFIPVVAKVLGEVPGIPLVGSLVGSLFDLSMEGSERLRTSVQRELEECLAKFYAGMLDAGPPALDEQVAQAMLDDDDFHAIVRACLGDVEASKTDAYGLCHHGAQDGDSRRREAMAALIHPGAARPVSRRA